VLDPQALIGSHHLATCSSVHGFDVCLHHKVRNIIVPGYLLCSDIAIFNHVANPGQEGLKVLRARVVPRVVCGLLGCRGVNQDRGGDVFIDGEPGQWDGSKKISCPILRLFQTTSESITISQNGLKYFQQAGCHLAIFK
jgi:hypothetical protein